jgi:hypothetical protein
VDCRPVRSGVKKYLGEGRGGEGCTQGCSEMTSLEAAMENASREVVSSEGLGELHLLEITFSTTLA